MYSTTEMGLGLRAVVENAYRKLRYEKDQAKRAEVDLQARREKLHLDKLASVLGETSYTWDAQVETRENDASITHPVLVVDGIKFLSNNGREPDIAVYILCSGGKVYHSGKVSTEMDRPMILEALGKILESAQCEGACPD